MAEKPYGYVQTKDGNDAYAIGHWSHIDGKPNIPSTESVESAANVASSAASAINSQVTNLDHISSELDRLSNLAGSAVAQSAYEGLASQVSVQGVAQEGLSNSVSEIENKLVSQSKEHSEILTSVADLTNEVDSQATIQKQLTESYVALNGVNDNQSSQISDLASSAADLADKLSSQSGGNNEVASEIQELSNRIASQDVIQSSLSNQYNALSAADSSKTVELSGLTSKANSMANVIKSQSATQDDLSESISSLASHVDSQDEAQVSLQSNVNSLSNELEQQASQVNPYPKVTTITLQSYSWFYSISDVSATEVQLTSEYGYLDLRFSITGTSAIQSNTQQLIATVSGFEGTPQVVTGINASYGTSVWQSDVGNVYVASKSSTSLTIGTEYKFGVTGGAKRFTTARIPLMY